MARGASNSDMATLSSSFDQKESNDLEETAYLGAKQLPTAVWEQCKIYFEETLHLQALTLLNNIVIAGVPAVQDPERQTVFVPPPFILALSATLAVHPLLTTRAGSDEALDAANAALDLLSVTFSLAGPWNARAAEAFTFAQQADTIASNKGMSVRKRRSIDGKNLQIGNEWAEDEDYYAINTRLAKESSLWSSAEDFWHVVGWSFNCALRHPARWERWQPWLDVMIKTLEEDWSTRVKVYKSQDANQSSKTILKDSMIFQYLLGARVNGATPSGRRRILRAILANGDENSLREWWQVFKDETKEKRKRDVRDFLNKTRKLDLDHGEFGDYGDDGDDEDLGSDDEILAQHDSFIKRESDGRRKRRSGRGTNTTDSGLSTPTIQSPTNTAAYGTIDALKLRRRLIFFLTSIPDHLPQEFATHEDMYDVLTELIRPLPLPIFTFMISPTPDNPARPSVLASWLKWLLYSLGSGPRDESAYVSQTVMQTYYLPFAARHNTLLDNARMAVTLEALLRLLLNSSQLQSQLGLREAVEKGIAARSKKAEAAASFGAKASSTETEELWVWLKCAEDGLRRIAGQIEDS